MNTLFFVVLNFTFTTSPDLTDNPRPSGPLHTLFLHSHSTPYHYIPSVPSHSPSSHPSHPFSILSAPHPAVASEQQKRA